jgi:hypothetical protein
MFENRVPRRRSGPQREERTGDWRRMHNEFLILYYAPNITFMTKSRTIKFAAYVAYI